MRPLSLSTRNADTQDTELTAKKTRARGARDPQKQQGAARNGADSTLKKMQKAQKDQQESQLRLALKKSCRRAAQASLRTPPMCQTR